MNWLSRSRMPDLGMAGWAVWRPALSIPSRHLKFPRWVTVCGTTTASFDRKWRMDTRSNSRIPG